MMRILRVAVAVVSSLVLVVVCGVATHAAWQTYQAHRLRTEVEREVGARLVAAVPTARNRRDRLVEAAGTEPARERLDQHCEFATDDAGWTVESYHQSCDLRSDLVWSAADQAQADALVARILTASGEPPQPWVTSPGPGCAYQQSGDVVVVVTDRECGYPSRLGLRPVQPPRGHRVRGLRVEVQTSASLGEYELGCRTVVLFCDNPFDQPAFGSVAHQS